MPRLAQHTTHMKRLLLQGTMETTALKHRDGQKGREAWGRQRNLEENPGSLSPSISLENVCLVTTVQAFVGTFSFRVINTSQAFQSYCLQTQSWRLPGDWQRIGLKTVLKHGNPLWILLLKKKDTTFRTIYIVCAAVFIPAANDGERVLELSPKQNYAFLNLPPSMDWEQHNST